MNPGKMDRKLTIQARTLSQDGTGGRVETWADAYDVWAELIEMRAAEMVAAQSERTHALMKFRIRWKAIAAGTHRILYRLKFYNILSIVEDGRNDRLVLTCESIQATT